MIEKCFIEWNRNIQNADFIEKQFTEKRKIDDFSGIIKGQLHFSNGILDFLEVIEFLPDRFPVKKKYKYHFMDFDNPLIFRYDNVPHHHNLDNFPNHKHTKNGVESALEPDIITVLKEIYIICD